MRGRKPVPTELRKLHGNPTKEPLPKYEPKPVGELGTAPEWLDAAQRDGWDYAMAHAPLGMLRRIDRGVLVAWVVAESLHRQAAIKQQSNPSLLVRKRDRPGAKLDETNLGVGPSPYLKIINDQAKVMIKAAEQLGFTPASRPRIAILPGDLHDGFGQAPNVAGPGSADETLDDWLAAAPPKATLN